MIRGEIYTAQKTERCQKCSVFLLINAMKKGTCSNFMMVVANQNVKLAERAGSID